jgi:hypothetical protein
MRPRRISNSIITIAPKILYILFSIFLAQVTALTSPRGHAAPAAVFAPKRKKYLLYLHVFWRKSRHLSCNASTPQSQQHSHHCAKNTYFVYMFFGASFGTYLATRPRRNRSSIRTTAPKTYFVKKIFGADHGINLATRPRRNSSNICTTAPKILILSKSLKDFWRKF